MKLDVTSYDASYLTTTRQKEDTLFCGNNYETSCRIHDNATFFSCQCYIPTNFPTFSPTGQPSTAPSIAPSISPSQFPSDSPSIHPTEAPSREPTNAPSSTPTVFPSSAPTKQPTSSPSAPPTVSPSVAPTITPTNAPSYNPTDSPTGSPTGAPTDATLGKTIYIFYNENIEDKLSLSLLTYAQDLVNATKTAMTTVMNDTSLETICSMIEENEGNGIDCELSNYNPFNDDNSDETIPSPNPTRQPSSSSSSSTSSTTSETTTRQPTAEPPPESITTTTITTTTTTTATTVTTTAIPTNVPSGQPTTIPTRPPSESPTLYRDEEVPTKSPSKPTHSPVYYSYQSPTGEPTAELTSEAGGRRRRRFLNDGYSYRYDGNGSDTGWWQARVNNLQFCYVLNLEWDPNACESFDLDVLKNTEVYVNNQVEFVAFGTFELVADENIQNFNNYFVSKLTNDSNSNSNSNDNGNPSSSSSSSLTFAQLLTQNMRNLIATDTQFSVVTVVVQDTVDEYHKPNVDEFQETALDITFGLYAFMLLCVIWAVIAQMDAMRSKADHVKPMRIVLFGVWSWDFVSDCIFSLRAFEQGYIIQGIASALFVIIPWGLNLRQLLRSQKEWAQDEAIKYAVTRWLMKNNKKLIILTVLCGSAFAAIELCNSRAFGRCSSFYNMGLTERHLKKFHGTRIYTTILFENVPQLIIQIWYFLARNDLDIVAALAFLSSVASIFIAMIDVYSSVALVQVKLYCTCTNTMFDVNCMFGFCLFANFDNCCVFCCCFQL